MGRDRDTAAAAAAGMRGGRKELDRPRYVTLPIIFVLAVIGYVYYVTVFGVIVDWLGLTTAAGLGNAVVFTALAFMCVATYAMAVLRDPGHVPSSFMPDMEDPQASVHEIKRKGGDLRYCQKCSHYKPPRAHHCRVCKRCVLRMDHHCVWINNCVGHANYKVFFVFMLYTVISCIHSLGLLLGFAYDVHKSQIPSGGSLRTSHIIYGVLLFPLALAVSLLLGWHIHLIAQNKTTIEHYEGVRAMWLAKKAGNVYQHPYDLGTYENLILLLWGSMDQNGIKDRFDAPIVKPVINVLGSNMLFWICPTSSHIGSGLRFPTSYESELERLPR